MPRPRRLRRGLIALLVTVLLLAAAGGALFVVRPGPVAGWLATATPSPTATAATPEPAPPAVLAAVGADAPAPTAAGVRGAIDGLVTDSGLGDRVNVSVVDVATGDSLYARDQEALTVPASTTKLVTAATVLAARGPAYRIATRAVAGAAPGEVVIVGGGDPTLAVNGTGTYPSAARLDRLAAQVKKSLGGVAPTRVTVDPSLYTGSEVGPDWDDGIVAEGSASEIVALMTDGARVDPKVRKGSAARVADPDLAAGRAFARALGLPASAVGAVKRGKAPAADAGGSAQPASPAADGAAPATPGGELGRVESPPMIRLVELMLAQSDNVLAEALARQVALAEGKPASYQGGAAAMEAVVAKLGLSADQLELADGSGLSRTNRIAPSLLTGMLTAAANGKQPPLAGLFAGLPVAAWSGTLEERFPGPAADRRAGAGAVRAKTGTLSGVNAISGVVVTAQGRLLAFAVLADAVPSDRARAEAEAALDRIAAKLAGCGCR
ncbi:MAG TPA: D-alanyl-D-alanine carboxypeptidase/D-alanyl-D-alanine-endopeptidase [Catenuloplanes sp.]